MTESEFDSLQSKLFRMIDKFLFENCNVDDNSVSREEVRKLLKFTNDEIADTVSSLFD